MNTQKYRKNVFVIPFAVLCFALGCCGLLPGAKALSPPPDGGYPNYTTAEGQNALLNLSTGIANTAVGWFSLGSVTTGGLNTGVGAGTLFANTGDQNTATGAVALLSNTTGSFNTAHGALALLSNTTGDNNTANGASALQSNTSGSNNTANGYLSLLSNTEGDDNTAVGVSALKSNTEGSSNTAVGRRALFSNTSGNDNTAIGIDALLSNTTGNYNTAIGYGALSPNTTGFNNTAIGVGTLFHSTGDNNTALGENAGVSVTTANHVIAIGSFGNNVDDSCYIGNIFDATSSGGTAVFINENGRLGTTTSSRRFKEKIKPMENASEALFALKPVTFRYKQEADPEGTGLPQFGLVAEDVEKVNPDLIIRDKKGQPYSVRYEAINAMLLNEFLKEHRKVEALEATVTQQQSINAEQQKELQALTASLKEQAAQIQKVSARIEITRPTPERVVRSH